MLSFYVLSLILLNIIVLSLFVLSVGALFKLIKRRNKLECFSLSDQILLYVVIKLLNKFPLNYNLGGQAWEPTKMKFSIPFGIAFLTDFK
jgi:hypothetical protein